MYLQGDKKLKERNRTLRQQETLLGWGYASIPLMGIFLFYVIPFGITIAYTFMDGTGNKAFVGLKNYVEVLQSEAFQLASKNTLFFILICVPAIICLGLIIALMLSKKLVGNRFFRPVIVFPLVLPVASVTKFFEIFFAKAGILNTLLGSAGPEGISYLNSKYAFVVLALLYLWKNTGFIIVLFLAGLSAIPKEYYEVAQVDGATYWQQHIKITIPLLYPTFFFTIIFSIINCFKAFREAFSLGGNYPNSSIYMLQHFMNNNFHNLNYGRLSVAALLTFIIIFLFVFLLWRGQRRNEQ